MKNRVLVEVANQEYTLISEEDPAYMRRVAAAVDREIKEITAGAHLSLSHAAVLAAVKLADKAEKASDNTEHLRAQIKDCLDETQKVKAELAEARREIFRLKAGKT